MDKLNNLLVGLSAPAQAVAARAAVRHVAEITVLPAVEARTLRVPLQHQHAQLSVLLKVAEVLAAVRPAAETIVHHAAEMTVLPAVEITTKHAAVITAITAVEARLERILIRYHHAENNSPRAAVKSQAVAGLDAGMTAKHAMVWPAVELILWGYLPQNFFRGKKDSRCIIDVRSDSGRSKLNAANFYAGNSSQHIIYKPSGP